MLLFDIYTVFLYMYACIYMRAVALLCSIASQFLYFFKIVCCRKHASFCSPLLIFLLPVPVYFASKELLWWRGDLSACSSVITPPQWEFQEKESGRDGGESKSSLFRFKALSLLSLNRNKGFLLNAASVFLHYAGYDCRTSFGCAVEVQTVVIMCHNTTRICRGMLSKM